MTVRDKLELMKSSAEKSPGHIDQSPLSAVLLLTQICFELLDKIEELESEEFHRETLRLEQSEHS